MPLNAVLVEQNARHPYRWVSCSIAEFGHNGSNRHLARKGAITTYCGYSATHAEIWRGDSRKPKCSTCESVESTLIPAAAASPASRTSQRNSPR